MILHEEGVTDTVFVIPDEKYGVVLAQKLG